MLLTKITIQNYRSIKKTSFPIEERDDKSHTFGLIGINEAGKSSILTAIGLKDGVVNSSGTKLPLSKDFRGKEDITITYSYKISQPNNKEIYEIINNKNTSQDSDKTDNSTDTEGDGEAEEKINENRKKDGEEIVDDLIVDYQITFTPESPDPSPSVTILRGSEKIEITDNNIFENCIYRNVHKTTFWTAKDRYLISEPINIEQFAADPSISIPLRNCFLLSSISVEKIKNKLEEALADTTECEYLEEQLGDNVTSHIKLAWPNHPIKVTFKIMDGQINFHVRDVGTKGKAQTSDMRSDGFKQFVSFLLTIAAQNKNEELENTILLLDEPETHLHPKAQEYLLTQMIEVTNNNKNNIVLFATHSNYMIDKKDLGRYFRIEKNKDEEHREHTEATQFDKKQTSYAEVSYEAFDILDEHYHNELYDKLRDWFVKDRNNNEKDELKHIETIGINAFDEQYFKQIKKLEKDYKDTSKRKNSSSKVTMPTFVRNCIHYPANKPEDFEDNLRESIGLLRKFIIEVIDSKSTIEV